LTVPGARVALVAEPRRNAARATPCPYCSILLVTVVLYARYHIEDLTKPSVEAHTSGRQRHTGSIIQLENGRLLSSIWTKSQAP
jgi:hypothetical protein